MNNLERELQNVRKSTIDYGILAREAFSQANADGQYKCLDRGVVAELIADYRTEIEIIVGRKVKEEVERLGKSTELEAVIGRGLDQDAYFAYAIPGIRTFLSKVAREAKLEAITGQR